jgi:hypothetical protein
MIAGSCHCGAVRYEVETAPETVTSCACSICRRTGVLCAYYSPKQVRVSGETDFYMWGDRMMEFHRCKVCGCHTHWTAVDRTYDRMGVNARMMPREVLDAAKIRYTGGPGSPA